MYNRFKDWFGFGDQQRRLFEVQVGIRLANQVVEQQEVRRFRHEGHKNSSAPRRNPAGPMTKPRHFWRRRQPKFTRR